MKFEKVNIDDLQEASYNPRKKLKPSDTEYQKIKRSIEEFGYVEPIIVNNDNTIIGGHQRLSVLKELGYKEIDVVKINVNKDDEKALNVALNKISGEWDIDMLSDLLNDLDDINYDFTITGFDELIKQEATLKENERVRTNEAYNLELYEEENSTGYFQMPIIKNDNFIPSDLIGFNYAKSSDNKKCGIHFYIDDYQFERVWNRPDDYVDILKEYECVLSPDFSLYMDMPIAMKIWNIYRSRLIGQYLQSKGIKVIPTISWAEEKTYDFCFDGIPEGSIVSISTVGVKERPEALTIWRNGVEEMIKRIKPSTILVYGGEIEFDYGDIEVIYYDNKVTERMKNLKNQEEVV